MIAPPTSTTPLSLHDALPISSAISGEGRTTIALGLAQTFASDLDVPSLLVEADLERPALAPRLGIAPGPGLCEVLRGERSEEHTSELQSRFDLVCRLLLEKKK